MRTLAGITLVFLAMATLTLAQSGELDKTDWKPIESSGRKITSTSAHIMFDGPRFSGNTGCNSMAGSVEVRTRGRVAFTNIIATERYCEPKEGDFAESDLLKALTDATNYSRTGERLVLKDRRGGTLLILIRQGS